MPRRAPHPCLEQGCGVLTTHGTRCDRCARKYEARDRERRGNAASRGYDAAWQKATAGFLTIHAWCENIDAHPFSPPRSQVVGHRVALRNSGKRLDPSNWIALCRSCNAKQAHDDGAYVGRANA